jgi:hypothetical protein
MMNRHPGESPSPSRIVIGMAVLQIVKHSSHQSQMKTRPALMLALKVFKGM